MIAHLAPRTDVLPRNIYLSTRVYISAGMVDRAAFIFSIHTVREPEKGQKSKQNLRPKNSAREVNVPCSASNRSNKGVSAKIFKNACKKPACIKGNVFVRYTVQVHYVSQLLAVYGGGGGSTGAETNLLWYERPPCLYIPH